jgi:hypothetical protein
MREARAKAQATAYVPIPSAAAAEGPSASLPASVASTVAVVDVSTDRRPSQPQGNGPAVPNPAAAADFMVVTVSAQGAVGNDAAAAPRKRGRPKKVVSPQPTAGASTEATAMASAISEIGQSAVPVVSPVQSPRLVTLSPASVPTGAVNVVPVQHQPAIGTPAPGAHLQQSASYRSNVPSRDENFATTQPAAGTPVPEAPQAENVQIYRFICYMQVQL